MVEDKRGCPRFLFPQPVAYVQPDVTVNGSIAGNISLSGISLRVQGFIPMGTLLELQIRLGEAPKVIWVKAQVVRMREALFDGCYEIGLKFVPDEIGMRAIGAYISASQAQPTLSIRS